MLLNKTAIPEDNLCETGWLQFRQDKCYRFVHIRMAFDDAENLCNSLYGGHLPSIHSQEEQFMLTQFLASVNVKNSSEIWIGGRQMDFHNFNWADGSLFNYSYWEQGEPNFPSERCIEMSWRNGRWNDISCKLKRAVLCERQLTRQPIKPFHYQPSICLLDSNCTTTTFSPSQSSPAQISTQLPIDQANNFEAANSTTEIPDESTSMKTYLPPDNHQVNSSYVATNGSDILPKAIVQASTESQLEGRIVKPQDDEKLPPTTTLINPPSTVTTKPELNSSAVMTTLTSLTSTSLDTNATISNVTDI